MLPLTVKVKWDDSCHNCIHLAIQGAWIWSDFELAIQEAHRLSDTVERSHFYYIFDVRNTHVFPRAGLHKIRRMRPQIHQKTRMILIIGQGVFADALRQTLEIALAGVENAIHQVKSPEEAYTLIDSDVTSEVIATG